MDKKLYELQEILEKCGKPNYTSSIPKDIKKKDVLDALCGHQGNIISEINMNNELISLLHNYTALPIECNLQQIEQLLKNYEPVKSNFFDTENVREEETSIGFRTASNKIPKKANGQTEDLDGECNVESYILDRIRNEILESVNNITWDDIVGLNNVKKIINEIVLWPMLRPDLFTGLRGPPKGLLLFGPPGTGKTMIGKCIASQCNATFFSISASSLTSKWVGEGEKMVRALFYLARKMQPSVIFIDEIDSLLTQRSENENEGSRRIKTEFLVQFDGTSTNENDRILVIGATNRPQEIDEAARRRLVKRIYVCLPSDVGRISMIKNLVKSYQNILNENDFREISLLTEGYSGSDMFNLCREASLEPLREIDNIKNFKSEDTRSINVDDFKKAMLQIKKSVSEKDLGIYEEWNNKFGSF